ncbi:MAG: YggU family protein [Deltaproteobacteria bacterium]|nr:YggU family protein [Deltaproteobacteria bacterium]
MHEQGNAVLLDVLVSPRASRNRVVAVHDNRIKIQLCAPPTDGQANDALVRFLAAALDVARAQIEIVGGATSKRKSVRVVGITGQRAMLRLLPPRQ